MLAGRRTEKTPISRKDSMEWAQSFSGLSFQCRAKCAACCRRAIGPGLTEGDYERISHRASDFPVAEKRDHPVFPYRLRTREGACLFLNPEGGCAIYSFRPLLCRLYPLQLHFQWDGKLLWCLEHCPGVDVAKGVALEGAYLERLFLEIVELETRPFLEKLRTYVLKTKNDLALLFKTESGGVYSDWPTKTKLKEMVWEMFGADALGILTPRARLECILHELLPAFEGILEKKAGRLGQKFFYIDQLILSDGFREYRRYFSELALESVGKEEKHLKDLAEKGRIAQGGGTNGTSVPGNIIVKGFDGRTIEIDPRKLMQIPEMTAEAYRWEENYLNELLRREGRFGIVSTDVTVNSEVKLMFLAADALELKANAFAMEKGKDRVGIEEMKEALWIVERQLSGLLEMAQESEI